MVLIVSISIGFFMVILGLVENIRVFEVMKGWVMSFVYKFVKVNLFRRIWKGVLGKVFFKNVVRMSVFL